MSYGVTGKAKTNTFSINNEQPCFLSHQETTGRSCDQAHHGSAVSCISYHLKDHPCYLIPQESNLRVFNHFLTQCYVTLRHDIKYSYALNSIGARQLRDCKSWDLDTQLLTVFILFCPAINWIFLEVFSNTLAIACK